MQIVVLVVVILVGVGLLQAAIWIPITRSWRRRAAQFDTGFRAQIEASGERIVIAQQTAVYRGGTGSYSAVKGNGVILFTDRRLLFRKRSGGLVEVPVDTVALAGSARSDRAAQVAAASSASSSSKSLALSGRVNDR